MKKIPDQQILKYVGENLYRSQSSRIYYALFKRDGKQIRKSLKTTAKELARRKLAQLREQVHRFKADASDDLPFAVFRRNEQTDEPTNELIGGMALSWFHVEMAGKKSSSRERRVGTIKALSRYFPGSVRNLTLWRLEEWYAERSEEVSARTLNMELETLNGILSYGCKHGILLDNPAAGLKRLPLTTKEIICPTREQFKGMLAFMRSSKGKRAAKPSADMVEFLAYSGWRVGEARKLRWQDVNFKHGRITIVGDEQTATKNRKAKTVPMSPPLIRLLQRLRDQSTPAPKVYDFVFGVDNPRKPIATACEALGYPSFTTHALRHFFITNAVEMGLDFRAVAGLVNHSDGGALLARRYAHLRDTHLAASVKKLTFYGSSDKPEAAKNITAATDWRAKKITLKREALRQEQVLEGLSTPKDSQ